MAEVLEGAEGFGRVEVAGEEGVGVEADLAGFHRIDALEGVGAGHLGEYFVFEVAVVEGQGVDHPLDFRHADIVVVHAGGDAQRFAELLGIGHGRAAGIFPGLFGGRRTDVVFHRVIVGVFGRLVAQPVAHIAHRNAGIAAGEFVGIAQQVHQRDHAAVAPADNAYPIRIHDVVAFHHVIARRHHVFVLQAAVVDILVKAPAVTGAAAVVRRDHNIALRQHLPENMHGSRGEIAVHAAVREDQQRILLILLRALGNEHIGIEFQRVVEQRILEGRPRHFPVGRRRSGQPDDIDMGNVAELLDEQQRFDLAVHGLGREIAVVLLCVSARREEKKRSEQKCGDG